VTVLLTVTASRLAAPAVHEGAYLQGDCRLTLTCAELCAFVCAVMLCLRRGGIVKGPLMLELGVLPDVSLCCLALRCPAAIACCRAAAFSFHFASYT
jgi:hypothetical protein